MPHTPAADYDLRHRASAPGSVVAREGMESFAFEMPAHLIVRIFGSDCMLNLSHVRQPVVSKPAEDRRSTFRARFDPSIGSGDADPSSTDKPGRAVKTAGRVFRADGEFMTAVRRCLGGRAVRQQYLLPLDVKDEAGTCIVCLALSTREPEGKDVAGRERVGFTYVKQAVGAGRADHLAGA